MIRLDLFYWLFLPLYKIKMILRRCGKLQQRCVTVVFLDLRRMGGLFLKAKGTPKFSLLLTLCDFEPWCEVPQESWGWSPSWHVVVSVPQPRGTELRAAHASSYLQGYGHGRQTGSAAGSFLRRWAVCDQAACMQVSVARCALLLASTGSAGRFWPNAAGGLSDTLNSCSS